MTDRAGGMSLLFVSTFVSRAQTRVDQPMAYVVEDLSKHLLRRYYQAHDLPYGHLKVHLGKLEHALEETRHLDFIPPRRWRRAKVGGPARRPWERYVRIHAGLCEVVSRL